MRIPLDSIKFENGFWFQNLMNGSIFCIYQNDEVFNDVKFDDFIVSIITPDNKVISNTSKIIGFKTPYYTIKSDIKTLNYCVLSKDNIKDCYIADGEE